jgi:hypothetical protein
MSKPIFAFKASKHKLSIPSIVESKELTKKISNHHKHALNSNFLTAAPMIANKNIKFLFKTDSLNTWNLNHSQKPRTYTYKNKKELNTPCHFLAESKTTLFHQN